MSRSNIWLGMASAGLIGLLHLPPLAKVGLASGDSLNRQIPLKSGGRLTLENTNGDIHITSWEEERVELRADATAKTDEELKLVPVEIQARDDEIRISSVYPVYAQALGVRVNYRLQVPRRIDLKLVKTVNGRVSVSDVAGRAIIEVGNGEITVKGFSGFLKATSTNGRIEAQVAEVGESGHVNLENYNGDISLRLPRNVKAHWDVRTLNGKIDSTIPFTVLSDFGPHVAHLDQSEDPVIHLYSVNGDLQIAER